jgi:hypothetical protein
LRLIDARSSTCAQPEGILPVFNNYHGHFFKTAQYLPLSPTILPDNNTHIWNELRARKRDSFSHACFLLKAKQRTLCKYCHMEGKFDRGAASAQFVDVQMPQPIPDHPRHHVHTRVTSCSVFQHACPLPASENRVRGYCRHCYKCDVVSRRLIVLFHRPKGRLAEKSNPICLAQMSPWTKTAISPRAWPRRTGLTKSLLPYF